MALDAKDIPSIIDVLKKDKGFVKEFGKAFGDLTKGIDKASKAAEDFSDEIYDLNRGVDSLASEIKGLQIEKGFRADKVREFTKELDDAQKGIKEIQKIGFTDPKEIDAATKAISEYKKKIEDTHIKIQAMTKSSGEVFGQVGEGLSGIKSLFSNIKNPKAFAESAKDAKNMGNKLKVSGATWETMTEKMGSAGKMAKMAGGAIGGLGKLAGLASGPLAIAMSVGSAVKAIWDFGNAADKVVKDANKGFAMVRGPDIMTPDVKGQFDDFNKQIYSTAQNWKDGVDADQIRGFTGALYQAGKTITDLNTGFNDYRSTIHIAAKASKSLGTDIVQVGNMMGVMMVDMKADLSTVNETFNEVAFDAKKAGLSTDRFWSTVQNASASLSMYGLITKGVAKNLKGMMEGGLGAQEAQSDVEDLTGAIKNSNMVTKATIIQFSGIKKAQQRYIKQAKGMRDSMKAEGKEIEDLEKKKAAAPEEEQGRYQARIDELSSVIDKQQTSAEIFEKAAKSNDPTVLAEAFESQAGDANEIFSDLATRISGQQDVGAISLEQLRVLEQTAGLTGNQFKSVKDLVNVMHKFNISNEKSIEKYSELIATKGAAGNEGVSDAIDELEKSLNDTEDKQIEATQKLEDQLVHNGMKSLMAKGIVRIAKTSEQARKLIKNGNATDLKAYWKDAKSGADKTKAAQEVFKESEKTKKELNAASESTLSDIVDQTLSYEDMQKIAMAEGTYRIAQLGYAQKLNDMVFSIFKKMKIEESEGSKQARSDLKERGIKIGGIFGKSPKEEAKILGTELGKLKKERGEIEKAGGDTEKIDEQIKQNMDTKNLLEQIDNTVSKVAGLYSKSPKEIGEQLTKSIKEGIPLEKLKSTFGDDIVNSINAEGAKLLINKFDRGGDIQLSTYEQTTLLGAEAGFGQANTTPPASPIKKEANLRTPEIVTSPGMVKLDPGEMIFPKGMDIKTLPTPGFTGPSKDINGKNISITVNANEKDLASRIANEIRSVLYKEQLTGMA